MTSTISFFVALAGIIAMMGVKAIEVKRQKKFILSRLAENTDHFVQRVYNLVKNGIAYVNKHNFITIIQVVAYHILSRIRAVYLHIHAKAHAHPHSKKVIDMVRGKGELPKAGGASFYLKRISEEN